MSLRPANVLYVSFNDSRSVIPNYVRESFGDKPLNPFVVTNQDMLGYIPNQILDYKDCIFGRHIDSPTSINIDLFTSMERSKTVTLEMYDRYRRFRSLMLYDSRVDLYDNQVFFWSDFLQKNNISYVVFGNVPHLGFDYVIYNLCKALDIPRLMFYRIPVLPGECVRYYTFEDIDNQLNSNFEKIYKSVHRLSSDKGVRKYLDLRGEKRVKTFHGRLDDKGGKVNIRRIVRGLCYRLEKTIIDYRNGKDTKSQIICLLSKVSNSLPNYLDSRQVDLIKERDYIFMPLHFQPEASSAPLGGIFADQSKIISAILSELPKNYLLIVKPHKLLGGHRQFYQRYKHDDRVKFVHASTESSVLMRNSQAVVTISGTLGWEAVLNSVPVLVFGSCFYQNAPGVFKIRNYADMKKAFLLIQRGISVDLEEIESYLNVLSALTDDGWVDNRYEALTDLSNEQNLLNQAKSITNWLKAYE